MNQPDALTAPSPPPAVPRYVLYGQHQEDAQNWYLNLEHLATRCEQRGWEIEPHSHPRFAQLIYVRSGGGKVILEGVELEAKSQSVMIIPVNCVHALQYQSFTDGHVITIALFYLQQLCEKLPEFKRLWSKPAVINLGQQAENVKELNALLTRLECELEGRQPGHFVAVESLLNIFFIELFRASNDEKTVETNQFSGNQLRLVESFQALIEEHYRQSWKISDFASALNVSVSQLRNACESVEAATPIKLLHQRKLTEANRNLLFTNMNIEQIAYWLGFSSPAYFTRFYKKETGVAPAEFRAQNKASVKPGEHA